MQYSVEDFSSKYKQLYPDFYEYLNFTTEDISEWFKNKISEMDRISVKKEGN